MLHLSLALLGGRGSGDCCVHLAQYLLHSSIEMVLEAGIRSLEIGTTGIHILLSGGVG